MCAWRSCWIRVFAIRRISLGPVDVLFHFAAQLPANDVSVEQYITANCRATSRILDAAVE